MTDTIIPVILSGGMGSRLWPISRALHPKPFIKLPDGQSLLHKTFVRACHLDNVPHVITITNQAYFLKSKAEFNLPLKNLADKPQPFFLLEPETRNTAPAIIFAALYAQYQFDENAILLVLPADHLIDDLNAFKQTATLAIKLARQNALVTFGIKPKRAETGYGYIKCGKALNFPHAFAVDAFIEKPEMASALEYLQDSAYLWNSGMFCFNVKTFLQECQTHALTLFTTAQHCFEVSQKNRREESITLDKNSFAACENISIDYALMEKSKKISVIACDLDWQDIGSWDAYKNLHVNDDNGNAVLGNALLLDSKDTFVHSENRIVATIGTENLHIIDTPDALLITTRERCQDVKQIVEKLKQRAHESYYNHRSVVKPWGHYTVLEESSFYKIKRLVLTPHAALSLQLHQKRSEHWVVVEGQASVINGEEHYVLKANQSTFIPAQTKHRLSNLGDEDLIIIEIQTGEYFGEDDILRFEDDYGRDVTSL